MANVEIILGSSSDLHFLWESNLLPRLDAAGITYAVSTCSAHRNSRHLASRIDGTVRPTAVYVCAAGWSAALPGAVKALLLGRSLAPVYGIALPSEAYPDAEDAKISIERVPGGVDVNYGGVGVDGFNAIADDVIEVARAYDPDLFSLDLDALEAVKAKIKPPWFDIPSPVSGKTKRIDPTPNPFEVDIVSSDDITAGDGAKRDVLPGKGAASTRTTCNIFELLEKNGISTHFVKRINDHTFRARNVNMIPLELIARRYAYGSYRDRFPNTPDGTVYDELVFEVFEKDDANHDPMLEFDFERGMLRRFVPNKKAAEDLDGTFQPGDLISEVPLADSRYADITPDTLARLHNLTVESFATIEEAWAALGGVYIDFKIECGFDSETGELVVADVIDSDSGRLRFGDKDMSKESYRDGSQSLPELKRNFEEVAELSDSFV